MDLKGRKFYTVNGRIGIIDRLSSYKPYATDFVCHYIDDDSNNKFLVSGNWIINHLINEDVKEKLQLGLEPQDVYVSKCKQQRIEDIKHAIDRYIETKKDIPYDWIRELNELENK